MYKRLNITLPDDVLARADAFAAKERYSRSGLIAAALEAFTSAKTGGASVARETGTVYAADAVGLNPAIRPLVPAIIEACRRHGATYAALVGSSTQPDPAVVPRDLDLLVRLAPALEGYSERYFGLLFELQEVTGKSVDVIEIDALRNPYLIREFERTRVVLCETA